MEELNIIEAVNMPVGTEIQKPISFMEALKAFNNGKTIRCIYEGDEYFYKWGIGYMLIDEDKNPISSTEILNGEWYIEGDGEYE